MNRRIFLKLGAGGLIIGGIGYTLFRMSDETLTSYAQKVIDEHLKIGGMVAGGVEQFVRDIRNAPYVTYQAKGLVFALSQTQDSPNDISSSKSLERFRTDFNRRLVSDYLLSSDFFLNQQTPGATVNYIGFANRMCAQANPFARFLDS